MQLKQQVCSLDLAKRLKELGVKQEGIFCWEDDSDEVYLITRAEANREGKEWSESCPTAFTVAELGEIIVDSGKNGYLNEIWKTDDWNFKDEQNGKYICADTEADIRARMVIYLLENNFIFTTTNQ